MTVGKSEITKLSSSYSQGPSGELFVLVGSSGYLEISANRGSASRLAGADKGSEVNLTLTGSASS